MDLLYFLDSEELLRFFHCHKTEISCLENPHTFLTQLRDHNLIPEESYKKVSRMRSKENKKKALYEILDCLEQEDSEHIRLFFECVFKETILSQYPTLRILRNSLTDGSFPYSTKIPERVKKDQKDERERPKLSEDEKTEANSVTKKMKLRKRSKCDDDGEQPGPSSKITQNLKKSNKKICFSSPQKGDKSDCCSWPIFKTQLPVTCGKEEGILIRDRLAKGEKCIVVKKQWFTPTEFEKFAGKGSHKNWKQSIRCMGVPLGKRIKMGQLKSAHHFRGSKTAKKSLFSSDDSSTASDQGEDEDETGNEDSNLEDQEEETLSSNEENSPTDTVD
ncbi:autoimmune regulator-like [Xenentodon cancila]